MLRILGRASSWTQAVVVWSVAMLGAACAPSRQAQPAGLLQPPATGLAAYPLAEVDSPPLLIKCWDVRGPAGNVISGVVWHQVTLGYVVTEAGQVDRASIVTGPTKTDRQRGPASHESIREARARAATCTYEPGMLAGTPVRVRVERTFRILASP